MHREVFSGRDGLVAIGEMPGVTVQEARRYTDPRRREVDMVFQFEHLEIDHGPGGRFDTLPFRLADLKAVLGRWQAGLADVGWNSLYWNNHDQPRVVSRFGDDGAHRTASAKALAILLHLHRGTPFLYQGEELGMANYPFTSVDELRDIQSLNHLRDSIARGMSEEAALAAVRRGARDNARTPMQWDAGEHAGFTRGRPWMAVNPDYTTVNAAAQTQDPDSVFNLYRRLITLRHELPVVARGDFTMLLGQHEQLYCFTRRFGHDELLVLVNASGEAARLPGSELDEWSRAQLLVTNIGEPTESSGGFTRLRPWEARVYRRECSP
jgi:oligo-1,6-glucosidase